MKIVDFVLENERSVKACARRVRLLAGLADLGRAQRANLSKCFTNVATMLLPQGESLRVELGFSAVSGPQLVEVVICSRSATALQKNNDVEQFAGLVDRFRLSTDAEGHTLIRIGQELPADAYIPSEQELLEWGPVLKARSTETALLEAHKRRRASEDEVAASQSRSDDLRRRLNLDERSLETLNMLSLVANKTDNLLMVLDTAGAAEWTNAAFTRMTGYTAEEIEAMRPLDLLFGQATAAESRRELDEAFRLAHGASEEIQLYRKNGTPFWTALTLTPVLGDGGDVARWIGVGADITKRRQAHEVLEQAKRAAEAASLAKSGFLANMSHEIRTPMNAIIGMTELALTTQLSAHQRDYLNMVKQSADALLALLNDILDLSKIESGKVEIESIPFHLGELLQSTLSPLSLRARERGLGFSWQTSADAPTNLRGDPHRIRQVLNNLVTNAIKFTDAGEVSIKVDCQWESDADVSLRFCVTDTGIGIPADRMERIFDVFEQADSSTTRLYGGTGLGLAICRELAQLLGGKIWVHSRVGKGSEFHFTARLQKSAESDGVGIRSSVVASKQPEQTPATQLQVLVVDDFPANRELAAAILSRRGHRVSIAESGRTAVAAVADRAFDVVLMDVQMPEMDGFQATTAIRDTEKSKGTHVPIIALTAHALKGDREQCLAAGMDAYLAKPIDATELTTLVESLAATGNPSCIASQPKADQPATGATYDFARALDRLMNDEELLKRQMDFFLADSPALLGRILSAFQEADFDELKIAAHRLKGLSASFDAHRASELAQQLENLGSGRNLVGCEPVLHELRTCVDVLRRAIETYLQDATDAQEDL